MDKYKKLLSNTIVFAIGTFGSKLLSFIMVGFYTAVFSGSPGSFSTADLVAQTANFLIPLASLSIAEAVIRFGLDSGSNRTAIFTNSTFLLMWGLAGLTLLIPLVNLVTKFDGYGFFLYMYVYAASFKQLCSQFVRARGLVRLFACDGMLTTFTLISLNFLLLGVFKLGVTGYLLSIILADVISIFFLWTTASLGRYLSPRTLDGSLIKTMLRYSLPLIPTAVLWIVVSISDRFFVAYISGDAANGLYTASTKIPMILGMASTFFTQAWQMSAIGEAANSRKETARFYTRVFGAYQSLMYIAAAGLLFLLKPLSSLLLRGEGFRTAWTYSPMLVIAMAFMCFCNFLASAYSASKRTVNSMVTSLIAALANIILNSLLIPTMGPQGAALATMVSYGLCLIVRLIDTRRFIPYSPGLPRMCISIPGLLVLSWFTLNQERIKLSWVWMLGICIIIGLVNLKPLLEALKGLLHRGRPETEGA